MKSFALGLGNGLIYVDASTMLG